MCDSSMLCCASAITMLGESPHSPKGARNFLIGIIKMRLQRSLKSVEFLKILGLNVVW